MLITRFTLPALAALCCAGALEAQQNQAPSHTGAFIARLGTDTISVERFSLAGGAYNVEQVIHTPVAALYHTHLGLTPMGTIGDVIYMHHDIQTPSAPLLASTRLTVKGDSAQVVSKRGDSTTTRTIAADAALVPSLPGAWLPYEIAARRLRASGADSATMHFLDVSGGTQRVIIRQVGPDSMTFTLPFLTYRAGIDADGRILGLYQPNGIRVERVPAIDISDIAARWDSLERQGRGMGPLSPRDSTSIRLGSAEVSVAYGRPGMRGREIWGGLVPWDRVWRTGANDPTKLTTTHELLIGSTVVPPGSYTLTTLPSPQGTKLIISTGGNGGSELGRVDLATTDLAAPVEKFTIELLPAQGNRGTLALSWDRRRMTAPIVVR